MPDSLLFDGVDDRIVFDDGNADHTGGWTIVVIAKLADDAGFENFVGVNTPTSDSIFGTNNAASRNLVVFPGGGSAVTSTFTIPSSDGWCVYAYSRPNDSAGKLHKYVYATDTWTHESNATSINDISDVTDIVLGCAGNIAQFFAGNMLIAGWWNSELSDGTIETLKTGSQQWLDADPDEAWRLDRLSAISSLTGTSVETARTGTTLDPGDAPAGWLDVFTVALGYQRIAGPVQLTTSPVTIYTAPADTQVEIRNFYVNNPSAGTVKVTASIGTDAASTRILESQDIAAGDSYRGRRMTNHILAPGEILQAFADTAGPVVVVNGYVRTI